MRPATVCAVVLTLTGTLCGQSDGPFQATGIKICEVDAGSAIVWARLTRAAQRTGDDRPLPVVQRQGGVPEVSYPDGADVDSIEGAVPGVAGEVQVRYRATGAEEWLATDWLAVDPERDFIAQLTLSALTPATPYEIEVVGRRDAEADPAPPVTGGFRTAPLADKSAKVVFTVSTGQAYAHQDAERGGFKIYDAMAALQPSFFVHTGDIVYYDKLAVSLPLARWHWARTYSLPTNVSFHRQVASYFIKDDHDTWQDDCWPTMESKRMGEFTFADGQAVFREQVGMSDETYRTFRWGKDLQIWLVEGRDYRSSNRDEDGPEKTIWGADQKLWFFNTVRASDATFRILISPTPIVGPDRDNKHDNHANDAFRHEGQEIRSFLASQPRMFVICGDRHWQYASVDQTTGLREYACGPASNAHAGGWSDDKRLAEHQYLRVTGGFLMVSVERIDTAPVLSFRHCNVDGGMLHEQQFRARPR